MKHLYAFVSRDSHLTQTSSTYSPLFTQCHTMEIVIVKNPLVYPFVGSVVIIDFLLFHCASWYRSIETDIPIGFGVDRPWGNRGHSSLYGQEPVLPQVRGQCPLQESFWLKHLSHVQESAVSINGDLSWDRIRSSVVAVKANKRAEIPFLTKPIGSIVVIG